MGRFPAPAQSPPSELADPQLARAAAAGERAAFEELYRRNVPAAWRVAQAVARNPDDASDAVADAFERVFRAVTTGRLSEGGSFRPYLLTATRRAAIDISRQARRSAPTDEAERFDRPTATAGPSERVVADMETRLLVEAFKDLPERWRSVLWLVEVEELSGRQAADVLGLTPNSVAQLAVRARTGLRRRYLAALVQNHSRPECRPVIEHLGAYVQGGLGRRRAAGVDRHLAECEACRRRVQELDDLGVSLRRSALPVPVALAAVVAGGWERVTARARHVGRRGLSQQLVERVPTGSAGSAAVPRPGSVWAWVANLAPQVAAGTPALERVAMWATTGLLVVGASAAVVRVQDGSATAGGGHPPARSAAGSPSVSSADPGPLGTGLPPVAVGAAAPGAETVAAATPTPSDALAGNGLAAGVDGTGALLETALSADTVSAIVPPADAVTSLVPLPEAVGSMLSPTEAVTSVLPLPAVSSLAPAADTVTSLVPAAASELPLGEGVTPTVPPPSLTPVVPDGASVFTGSVTAAGDARPISQPAGALASAPADGMRAMDPMRQESVPPLPTPEELTSTLPVPPLPTPEELTSTLPVPPLPTPEELTSTLPVPPLPTPEELTSTLPVPPLPTPEELTSTLPVPPLPTPEELTSTLPVPPLPTPEDLTSALPVPPLPEVAMPQVPVADDGIPALLPPGDVTMALATQEAILRSLEQDAKALDLAAAGPPLTLPTPAPPIPSALQPVVLTAPQS